jgi:hypothetical protein
MFAFTHNNWTESDLQNFKALHSAGYVTWLIIGSEIAPSTGTPHLQGAFWTAQPQQLTNVKKRLKGTWVGVPGAKKGPDYWVTYCSKESLACHLGVKPTDEEFLAQCPKGQGARTDLATVGKFIRDGGTVDAAMDNPDMLGPLVHHDKFFRRYQAHHRRRTVWRVPEVHWLYGPTGTGKTKAFHDRILADGDGEGSDIYNYWVWTPGHGKWFDGYCGQNYVLFDEFRGQLAYSYLLTLLDGHPSIQVEVKGSMIYWSPEVIYITSCDSPEDVFWQQVDSGTDSIEQLLRRITTVTFTGPPEESEEPEQAAAPALVQTRLIARITGD